MRPPILRHQLRGYPQSQAGAAVLARGGAIGLSESFENDGLLLRGDADARVANFEAQQHFLRRPLFAAHMDDHFARFREFDGIADQVQQNLSQAQRVAQ